MNGSTEGLCPQFSFNPANNEISNSGYTYDADGNITNDGHYAYQYDAEGRLVYVTNVPPGSWSQTSVYNALGEHVEDDFPDGQYTRRLIYPLDIEGHWTEIFDDWPSQNWAGADVFDARVAGERLQMGGSSSYLLHADAVGSTTMATDQAGTVDMDNLFYPWGQVWQQTGPNIWASFADLGFTNVGDVYPAEHRDYQATLGRWLVPDPAGQMAVDPANPQTWNMYAYVGDNPTTLNDPSGLDWVWVGGCAHYSATTDFYTSVAGYADKTYRGSYTYSMSMGQCSGIADGDYNRIGPTPNTSGQYRSRNAMYVAAQQASWWATFANSLFSWKNFTDEFKQGGCVHDFGEAIKKQMHEVGEVGKETKEMAERVAQGAPGLSGAGLTIGGSAGVLLFSAGQKLQSAAEYVGSRAPEVATGYGDYVLGNALSKELSDMGNGGCH